MRPMLYNRTVLGSATKMRKRFRHFDENPANVQAGESHSATEIGNLQRRRRRVRAPRPTPSPMRPSSRPLFTNKVIEVTAEHARDWSGRNIVTALFS